MKFSQLPPCLENWTDPESVSSFPCLDTLGPAHQGFMSSWGGGMKNSDLVDFSQCIRCTMGLTVSSSFLQLVIKSKTEVAALHATLNLRKSF